MDDAQTKRRGGWSGWYLLFRSDGNGKVAEIPAARIIGTRFGKDRARGLQYGRRANETARRLERVVPAVQIGRKRESCRDSGCEDNRHAVWQRSRTGSAIWTTRKRNGEAAGAGGTCCSDRTETGKLQRFRLRG